MTFRAKTSGIPGNPPEILVARQLIGIPGVPPEIQVNRNLEATLASLATPLWTHLRYKHVTYALWMVPRNAMSHTSKTIIYTK